MESNALQILLYLSPLQLSKTTSEEPEYVTMDTLSFLFKVFASILNDLIAIGPLSELSIEPDESTRKTKLLSHMSFSTSFAFTDIISSLFSSFQGQFPISYATVNVLSSSVCGISYSK